MLVSVYGGENKIIQNAAKEQAGACSANKKHTLALLEISANETSFTDGNSEVFGSTTDIIAVKMVY